MWPQRVQTKHVAVRLAQSTLKNVATGVLSWASRSSNDVPPQWLHDRGRPATRGPLDGGGGADPSGDSQLDSADEKLGSCDECCTDRCRRPRCSWMTANGITTPANSSRMTSTSTAPVWPDGRYPA